MGSSFLRFLNTVHFDYYMSKEIIMKKLTALLLAFVLIVSAAACAQKSATPTTAKTPASSSPSPSATPITITDMKGRGITLSKPAEKIVTLAPSDCEILYALGAGDKIVGRGEFCDYPAEVSSVPVVQSGGETNIEQIIALGPDVVIMSTMAQTLEQVASLENAGIKVIISDAKNIEDIYKAITLIGHVVGKNDAAKTIVDGMKKTFDDIKEKVRQNNQANSGKTIYFEVSPLACGLYTAGSGTYMDDIALMLGLKNTFGDLQSWAEISEERVLQRNPDYIVSTTMSYDNSQTPVDEILNRKGWENIPAIKNHAIYNADSDSYALMHPGPRLAEAVQHLYDFIYSGSTPSPSE